jgi:hypothetical protein
MPEKIRGSGYALEEMGGRGRVPIRSLKILGFLMELVVKKGGYVIDANVIGFIYLNLHP